MAGIRATNTKPEMQLRKGLHAAGFRFRLHDRALPGKPDIVLPRHRAVVLAHGCFWHGHDCHLFKWPSTRVEFWREKIGRNQVVDLRTRDALHALGWRQATVWECALKGRTRLPFPDVTELLAGWIREGGDFLEIAGTRE